MFGFRNIFDYVPENYIYKAALLQAIPLIVCLILINFSKIDNQILSISIPYSTSFYYISFFINLASIVYGGFFTGILNGSINGTVFGYLSVIFDITILFLIVLFDVNKKNNKIFLIISYLFIQYMYSSRSAPFWLIIFLFCRSAFENEKIKKNTIVGILVLVCVAPVGFVAATLARGTNYNETHLYNFTDRMISRLSIPEAGGVYLYQLENEIYNNDVFERKYSLSNQAKLAVNSLIPGNVFMPTDIDPNQYARSVFLRWDEEDCPLEYTSLNLTLPIYLRLKYNLLISLLFSTLFLYIAFRLCVKFQGTFGISLITIYGIYELYYFFDWVMFTRRISTVVFTLLVVKSISIIILQMQKRQKVFKNIIEEA